MPERAIEWHRLRASHEPHTSKPKLAKRDHARIYNHALAAAAIELAESVAASTITEPCGSGTIRTTGFPSKATLDAYLALRIEGGTP